MTDEIEGVLESQPVKWEYFLKYIVHKRLELNLDTYGAEGWEAVSVLPEDDLLLVIFKRPVLPEAANDRR